MRFIHCKHCKSTNFKLNTHYVGISIYCNHCLSVTHLNGYDDISSINNKYEYKYIIMED